MVFEQVVGRGLGAGRLVFEAPVLAADRVEQAGGGGVRDRGQTVAEPGFLEKAEEVAGADVQAQLDYRELPEVEVGGGDAALEACLPLGAELYDVGAEDPVEPFGPRVGLGLGRLGGRLVAGRRARRGAGRPGGGRGRGPRPGRRRGARCGPPRR